jgi:L-fuconolactonase
MTLDAHQHFWRYRPAEYPWIRPGSPIQRDFLPEDLEPLLRQAGFDGCVAVQARQSLEESRWLLELADQWPFIRGVVGWVDLRAERVEDQLAELASHPRCVGVRHVVQDEPDDQFVLRPDFLRGLGQLRRFGLTYDVLIFPRQLPAAIELARRLPEQPMVLDHLAKPRIRDGVLRPWREQIRELARQPNVFCKVSGLVTEADWTRWRAADCRPYLDVVFEAFGPERLMFGSDWPVCLLAASYEQVVGLVNDYLAGLAPDVRRAVLGANAIKFYQLDRANGREADASTLRA